MASLEERKQKIIAEGKEKKYIDRIGEWYLKDVAYEIVDASDDVYFDGAQTDVALKKIEGLSNSEKPFFFAIGFYRPHLPFNVPKKYWVCIQGLILIHNFYSSPAPGLNQIGGRCLLLQNYESNLFATFLIY